MVKAIPSPSKEELLKAYDGNSISEVARIFKTSNPTVRKWMIDFQIPRKSHKVASQEANKKNSARLPTKEELLESYETLSLKELQTKYNTSQTTLYQWFDIYDIELKSLSKACEEAKARQFEHLNFSKKTIEELYNRHKNIQSCADEICVSYSFMRNTLKKHGIEAQIPWRSQGEMKLAEFCQALDSSVILNDKKIINPFELDIVFPNQKLAIEYCGLYWHSETFSNKPKDYHFNKYNLCKEKGYKLLTIFEDDDIEKVKGLISSYLRLNEKIFARKCEIQEISPKHARLFHMKHHLSGDTKGSNIHYGLINENELVMVLSVGHSRFNKKYDLEIHRLTSHKDKSIIGGASKLIKKISNKKVITYADLRFGDGNVYEKCGFSFKNITSPNYWYFHKDKLIRHSRVKFQKHKLKDLLPSYDEEKTEYENMVINKYGRVWDCGNAVFSKD